MVLHKEVNLITLHYFIWYIFSITLHPSTFECLCIPNSNHSNHKCKVLIALQLGLHVEKHDPTPHAIMPRSQRMWLEANLTNVDLETSSVYCKSPWNLSHFKGACLLTLAIAFYSLHQNWAKRLFKTFTFIVTWSWTF
jgi:hypothetical protein